MHICLLLRELTDCTSSWSRAVAETALHFFGRKTERAIELKKTCRVIILAPNQHKSNTNGIYVFAALTSSHFVFSVIWILAVLMCQC